MELQLKPELEAQLNDLASVTGREKSELVQDALATYFEQLTELRTLLETRYRDIDSGGVIPIDGASAFDLLMQKSKARRDAGL